MSNKLINLVYDNESGNLNITENSLLVALADISADDGTSIFPSYNRIAKKIKSDRRTAIRTVDALCKKGYLFKKARFPEGRQTSNNYYINVKKLWKEANKDAPATPEEIQFEGEEEAKEYGDTMSPPSDTESPPQCQNVTPPVTQSHPNPPLTLSLSSSSKSEKSEPTLPPGAEFRAEPYQHANLLADADLPLARDLQAQGVSRGTILALLRSYPNRLHIRQSLERMIEVIKRKGVPSPDGFMRHLMNTDPYIPEAEKVAPKRAPKLHHDASASAKIIQASIQRDVIKELPQSKQANVGAMRDAAKMLPSLARQLRARQAQQ